MPVQLLKKLRTLLPTPKKKQPRWVSYLYLGITTICWGAAMVVVKPSLSHASATDVLLIRFIVASILSTPFILKYWPTVVNKFKTVSTIVLLELLGTTLTLTLVYEGLARTSAIEANLITTSSPIFVVLAGSIILKEKQELHETVGLMIAFTATTLLTILPVLGEVGTLSISILGNLMIIGQNVTAGTYYVLAKKYYKDVPKLFATSISFYVGAVTFLIINIARQGWSLPNFITHNQEILTHPSVWVAGLYLAIFGSIIGLTAYIKGQDGIEASEASFFFYLQPLVYLPLIFFALGDSVTFNQFLLLIMILIGVIVAERRAPSKPYKSQ